MLLALLFADVRVDLVCAVCRERAIASMELRAIVRSWSVFMF